MKQTAISAVLGISLVLLTSSAWAWGKDGHRIICAVAWDELKDPARRQVQSLLDIQTREQFADLCLWADEYRPSHPETAPWHFMNVPKDSLSLDIGRDCPEPRSCVVAQIDRDLGTLRTSGPKDAKATALKFLIHFVGDMHQPLHIGFAFDKGGNEIRGTLLGKSTNLHEVWDTGLIEARGVPWEKTAADLKKGMTALDRNLRSGGTPLDWANEVYGFTRMPITNYVDNLGHFEYGEVYVSENMPAALDVMTRAAIRLGYLLNETWK